LRDFFSEKKNGTINVNALKNNRFMKKIITSILFIILLIASSILNAQTTHPFELGFNAGASWLKSDIKIKKLGGGGGFTFGQMYFENENHFFDLGWRFRYLNAVQYGQSNEKFSGIANNIVLNGTTDTALNYYSNGGFIYQNYKTTLNECSLELVIGLNQMRNKTKFYPYVFGGLGITKAIVKTNQLNDNNLRYNYAKVDSLGTASGSGISSNLNNLYDGSYETTAEGSRNPSWKFMPSLGLGLGYQATKVVSIGLEYKATWALSDGLDGQQWANDNTRSTTNDKYYYASAWLKFSFGRAIKPINTTTTNTTVTDPNTFTTAGDKPLINVINPSVSPYTSPSQSYTVKATVKNVTSKSDIGLVYNGVSNSNFIYDATTQIFLFPLILLNGNNSFMITATNGNGSSIANATVLFESPIVVPPPTPAPIITITSPGTNPFSTAMNNATVVATVLNVTSSSQIGVAINGAATSAFIFNAASHTLNLNTNLNQGANTVVISAANSSGSDSKSITIIYNVQVTPVSPPPIITIVNPAVNPYNSGVTPLPINAVVQNVTAIGQVSASINGGPVPTSMLMFNTASGQLSFSANLIAGANAVTISATNAVGADSKTETVIYTPQVIAVPAPIVTITSPTGNPFNTGSNSIVVTATVLNVASAGQIAVSVNGVSTSAYTFNTATKQLSLNSALIVGANVIVISATNSAGADSKSETVIYTQPTVVIPGPIITVALPTTNPFNTSINTATVNATILNVNTMSQIAVTLNGSATSSFTFNAVTKQFSFPANLIVGANLVTIVATNISGTDSKSQTIIYSQPTAVVTPPVVTITSPTVNPFNTSISTSVVNGAVLNVSSVSQIVVSINGTLTSVFTFNASSHALVIPVTLILGANTITITATNSAGADTKSETIIYAQPVVVLPPVVTITSPSLATSSTALAVYNVEGTVTNVSAPGNITVKVNGTVITSFAFVVMTHKVKFNANLVDGANTIVISGNNSAGSDSKTVTILLVKNIEPMQPDSMITPANRLTPGGPLHGGGGTAGKPTIIFLLSNPYSTTDAVITSTAVVIPFTYNVHSKTITFTGNLNVGANTLSVDATNGVGTKTETLVITRH
jgi:hypothetical protein